MTNTVSFTVMSPDDLPISPRAYATRAQAERALTAWCRRFEGQGYYASVRERIALDVLPARCRIVEARTCPLCGSALTKETGVISEPCLSVGMTLVRVARPATFWSCWTCEHCEEVTRGAL